MNWLFKGSFLIFTAMQMSCSADAPDGEACELKCDKRKVGSRNYVIRATTPTLNITCSGTGNLSTHLFEFYVEEKIADLGNSDAIYEKSKDKDGVLQKHPDRVPIANLAFVPDWADRIVGWTEQTVGDNNQLVNTPKTDKYIVTPKEDWCTDSCGRATVKVNLGGCGKYEWTQGISLGGALYDEGSGPVAVKVSTD
jgi:hypothetical protein